MSSVSLDHGIGHENRADLALCQGREGHGVAVHHAAIGVGEDHATGSVADLVGNLHVGQVAIAVVGNDDLVLDSLVLCLQAAVFCVVVPMCAGG